MNKIVYFKKYSSIFLYISWLISLISTLGSLYFSEIEEFVPCELCWYQRIIMYPMVLMLGLATIKKETIIAKYLVLLSILGSIVSLLHYFLQKDIIFHQVTSCMYGVPCDTNYINWLGFITIPFLAFIGFALITILLTLINISESRW